MEKNKLTWNEWVLVVLMFVIMIFAAMTSQHQVQVYAQHWVDSQSTGGQYELEQN